jgi:anaerobic ribonucleoside-triphosphate reductase activating protein
MNYSGITYPDVNNGLGCRVTLFVSGCTHRCKGCHNVPTWDFNFGHEFTIDTKIELFELVSKPYIKGLTISGGDPLDNYNDVLLLVKELREVFGKSKDIWLYTGYVMEDLITLGKDEILNYIDVLVDGEYDESQRDVSLAFRGSSNQRIIYLN